MKFARTVVLGIALMTGGAAAFPAGSGHASQPLPASAAVAQLAATDLSIATNDINMGAAVGARDFQWPQWPTGNGMTTMAPR